MEHVYPNDRSVWSCAVYLQKDGGWRAISGGGFGDETLKVWDLEAGSEVATWRCGTSRPGVVRPGEWDHGQVSCCATYGQDMSKMHVPRILALLACGSSRRSVARGSSNGSGEFRSIAFRSVCRLRRATRLISEFAAERAFGLIAAGGATVNALSLYDTELLARNNIWDAP